MPISRLNVLTAYSGKYQTRDYYLHIGPTFADPVARALYAEIASIEEQHLTQYGSIIDPSETWLEKWVLHEANEVYNYYSCVETESNPRIKAIWERFLDYELGHLNLVTALVKKYEKRDPAEILPELLPQPIAFENQCEFVREVLRRDVNLRSAGPDYVSTTQETPRTLEYRREFNAAGSPSEAIAQNYRWLPGTELSRNLR